jgi:hypothetical protein
MANLVSAFGGKADMEIALRNVLLNNFLVFPLYMTRYRIIVNSGYQVSSPPQPGESLNDRTRLNRHRKNSTARCYR